ncbi:MAG: hypothetical protein QNK23_08355 [Crocinitomicaceae bacterium]|nr:hypothetical protein [Crocinitomicaceae bacterium]
MNRIVLILVSLFLFTACGSHRLVHSSNTSFNKRKHLRGIHFSTNGFKKSESSSEQTNLGTSNPISATSAEVNLDTQTIVTSQEQVQMKDSITATVTVKETGERQRIHNNFTNRSGLGFFSSLTQLKIIETPPNHSSRYSMPTGDDSILWWGIFLGIGVWVAIAAIVLFIIWGVLFANGATTLIAIWIPVGVLLLAIVLWAIYLWSPLGPW